MCLSCSINTFQRGSTERAAAAAVGQSRHERFPALCCRLPAQPGRPMFPKAAKCLSLGAAGIGRGIASATAFFTIFLGVFLLLFCVFFWLVGWLSPIVTNRQKPKGS